MDILLPKNGEGFTLRSFMREDIEQLADIEFDPEVKRYLALPIKRKSQWIKELEINIYNGNAIEVNGVIAGRASLLRVSKGEHRGSRELAIRSGPIQLDSSIAKLRSYFLYDYFFIKKRNAENEQET